MHLEAKAESAAPALVARAIDIGALRPGRDRQCT
jgi:hypothetical protein